MAVHPHAECEDSRCGTVSNPTGLSRTWPIWTRTYYFGLVCNPVGTAFWLPGSIPGVCSFASLCIAAIAAVCKTATFDTPVVRVHHGALGLMGVAACVTDGIARISPLELVGDKRLPALIRRLMTEGEARPNGCIDVSRSLPLVVKASPPCRCHANLDNN